MYNWFTRLKKNCMRLRRGRMEDHPYIKLIKFALEKKGGYFTVEQAQNASGLNDAELGRAHKALFVEPHPDYVYIYRTDRPPRVAHPKTEWYWVLSPDALFGYISHLQHQDANRNARYTHFMVLISILVSFATLCVVFYGLGAAGTDCSG